MNGMGSWIFFRSSLVPSRFFCTFATLTPYFISFPDTQWACKITTDNINIKWSLNRLKQYINFFFSIFLLSFLVSLGNFILFDQSTSRTTETGNSIQFRISIQEAETGGWRTAHFQKGLSIVRGLNVTNDAQWCS